MCGEEEERLKDEQIEIFMFWFLEPDIGEIIGNQLSFTACFMFTAARIHFLCMI